MANLIPPETLAGDAAKRRRVTLHHRHDDDYHHQPSDLIPGLPDHVAQLCLSLVKPSLLFSVCRSWRRLIYSPSFPPFLSLYTVLLSKNTDHADHSYNSIKFFNFDPISSSWNLLPPPPPDLRLVLRHPSFISRRMPIQSVTVSGHLVVLAATTHNLFPALSRPLIFNPISGQWTFGPELTTPRRWCAAGSINNGTIYVASGIGSQYSADIAKLVEKWEFFRSSKSQRGQKWKWEQVKGLKDVRFSRDAIDAIGYRGKLYMVNVSGDTAKEGLAYDTKRDIWEDMPEGMLSGWKGPAAAMDEEEMYVVDGKKGALKKYNPSKDEWECVVEAENLKGEAKQMVASGGRVCVVRGGGSEIAVVDVVAVPVRLWVVDTPPEFEAVAVHILPRMSKQEVGFPVTS